jgi:hypothetical protein
VERLLEIKVNNKGEEQQQQQIPQLPPPPSTAPPHQQQESQAWSHLNFIHITYTTWCLVCCLHIYRSSPWISGKQGEDMCVFLVYVSTKACCARWLANLHFSAGCAVLQSCKGGWVS